MNHNQYSPICTESSPSLHYLAHNSTNKLPPLPSMPNLTSQKHIQICSSRDLIATKSRVPFIICSTATNYTNQLQLILRPAARSPHSHFSILVIIQVFTPVTNLGHIQRPASAVQSRQFRTP